jgi:hypothetical protein
MSLVAEAFRSVSTRGETSHTPRIVVGTVTEPKTADRIGRDDKSECLRHASRIHAITALA